MAERRIIDLTEAQIAAARENDLEALTAVIKAAENQVLHHAAKQATIAGWYDAELAEDLAQVGRITLYGAMSQFEGTTAAQFVRFVDKTLYSAMTDERRRETRQGVSHEIARRFEDALTKAGGDPFEAERIAADKTISGKYVMAKETAYAARLAWSGALSLDMPWSSGESTGEKTTLGDLIASEIGIPEDMLTTRDAEKYKRDETKRAVHATLAKLSDRMSGVLRSDFGIGNAVYYGGAGAADAEMAADMKLTAYQVQQARNNGKDRFRVVYLKGANA